MQSDAKSDLSEREMPAFSLAPWHSRRVISEASAEPCIALAIDDRYTDLRP